MQARQRPDPQKSLVGFAVGNVHYAIPIGCVREIINPISLTKLPHAPDSIAGVADHRGDVIPIVDMRIRFGITESDERRRTKWILVEVADRTVGLVVDRVIGVFGTGNNGLRPAPSLGGGEDLRGIIGVTSHENSMVFVLEVDRIEALTASLQLPEPQMAAHEDA